MDSPVMHDHEDCGRKRDLLALLPHLSGSAEDAEHPPEDMPARKRIKSTSDRRCPVLENVAPGASHRERVELLTKIIDLRGNVPEGCSIAVFQRPDKTYFAIYVAADDAADDAALTQVKKRSKKAKQNGDKTVKKSKARPSQQQIMREEAAQLADAIAATAPGCVAPKTAEPVAAAPPPPPAPCGLGRGKGLMFANQDVLGQSRRVYGDTIPLVENPTPSGVILIPDACACPCGCKSTETPAKSARLDLTSKKRACNSCTLNQGRKMKACWDKQDEDVKRHIMEEVEVAGSAEAPDS